MTLITCIISTLGLSITLYKGDITPKRGYAVTSAGESIAYELVYKDLDSLDNYLEAVDTKGRSVTFVPECNEGGTI